METKNLHRARSRPLLKGLIAALSAGVLFACVMNGGLATGSETDMLNPNPNTSSDYYPGTEKYGDLLVNGFVHTASDSLSTFAADVDDGSYTLARKKINEGGMPEPASIRVEEFINYFDPEYASSGDGPLALHADGSPSPFRDGRVLLRLGLSTPEVKPSDRKPWNLTFLVDVSGSMETRLDLVKQSLNLLTDQLREGDKISLVTYAGNVRKVIAPTPVNSKAAIKSAISDLNAGGSTAMASGIQLAYDTNLEGFIADGENRVIVCSDGDANVGDTSHEAILESIAGYAKRGITLSTLGFGEGNYNAVMMEQLADKGNGNYSYIDSEKEARRLFSGPLPSLLQTLAFDVKIQVEFRAAAVESYRLIGYENRDLADSSFRNENTDAGEIGPGHRVTALYEIKPVPGGPLAGGAGGDGEAAVLRVRYKVPGGQSDISLERPVRASDFAATPAAANPRLRFAAGVAEFADLLRGNPLVEGTTPAKVEEVVAAAASQRAEDQEFLGLLRKVMGKMGKTEEKVAAY